VLIGQLTPDPAVDPRIVGLDDTKCRWVRAAAAEGPPPAGR
jgi:hypothetical protein